MNHTGLFLSSQSWSSFTEPGGTEGWVGLGGRLHTEINVPYRVLNQDTVTHLSTNRARRRLTLLIEANALRYARPPPCPIPTALKDAPMRNCFKTAINNVSNGTSDRNDILIQHVGMSLANCYFKKSYLNKQLWAGLQTSTVSHDTIAIAVRLPSNGKLEPGCM